MVAVFNVKLFCLATRVQNDGFPGEERMYRDARKCNATRSIGSFSPSLRFSSMRLAVGCWLLGVRKDTVRLVSAPSYDRIRHRGVNLFIVIIESWPLRGV